jgi:hypothetical protein
MQPERPQDAPVELLTERAAAGRLHDQAEQEVAGVGVRPGRARREVRRLVGHQGNQLPRGPDGNRPPGDRYSVCSTVAQLWGTPLV